MKTKGIHQIGDTPLSISIYSVEQTATRMNDRGTLEIIFCLKGSVKFTYVYEEFTLHAGEFISVDKDAYYLYDGKDNLCVSFHIDLKRYVEKYPFIVSNLFICEGTKETTMEYPTSAHSRLKGLMISTLKCIAEGTDAETIEDVTGKIVDLFVEKFDITVFYTGISDLPAEVLERNRIFQQYMHQHYTDKITIQDLARESNLTEGYASEFMRKWSLGFRKMIGYIRANESENMLLKTNKSIVEISESCGFSDVKYYYEAFKRWYRCTPKQFREKYGKNSIDKVEYKSFDSINNILDGLLMDHYKEIFIG